MNDDIIISKSALEKENVTLGEYLYLLALYRGEEINIKTIMSLQRKHMAVLPMEPGRPVPITAFGKGVVESVILNSEFKGDEKNPEDRFEVLAEELRGMYPEGKKPGTNYLWRDSKAVITKRLKTLVKRYGVEFTNEEAIEATKKYIASFNGNYQYMQLLKYFIYRLIPDESSQLLSYIENADSIENNNDDWMTNLV